MSASLSNTVALVNNQTFTHRVEAAVVEHAVTIASESSTTPWPPRVGLAMSVLVDPTNRARTFVRLAANDPTISGCDSPADVPDDDLRRVVSTLWSAVAIAAPNV